MTETPAIDHSPRRAPSALPPAAAGLNQRAQAISDRSSGHSPGHQNQPGDAQAKPAAPVSETADATPADAATPGFAAPALSTSLARPTAALPTASSLSNPRPLSAAAVVDQVGLSLETMKPQANGRMDLHLALEGGGHVSIELQMRDGAIHASFSTESTELRAALQQSWSTLAARTENLGVHLSPPVFKSPTTAAGQQNFRERREEPAPEQNHPAPTFSSTPQPRRSAPAPIAPARAAAAAGLHLWA